MIGAFVVDLILIDSFDIFFSLVFGINEDVIKVYYHKNVKLFYWNLIDIVFEYNRYICQSKRYHLVLEMAVAGPKSHLLFIVLFYSYLIISID